MKPIDRPGHFQVDPDQVLSSCAVVRFIVSQVLAIRKHTIRRGISQVHERTPCRSVRRTSGIRSHQISGGCVIIGQCIMHPVCTARCTWKHFDSRRGDVADECTTGWLILAAALTLGRMQRGSNSAVRPGHRRHRRKRRRIPAAMARARNASSFLTQADVQTVIAQAVNEAAGARQAGGDFRGRSGRQRPRRVSDGGASATVRIQGEIACDGGLEGLDVPPELAAISKAIPPVYFSSEGNAFTRAPPADRARTLQYGRYGLACRPAVRVQISNLPCSDHQPALTTGVRSRPASRAARPVARSRRYTFIQGGVPVGAVGVSGAKPFVYFGYECRGSRFQRR